MAEVWVTIGAAVIGAGASVYGTDQANKRAKGSAVPYSPVDYTQVQKDAIEGNLANSSSIERLISQGNSFNASQALSIQNQTMPGYSDLAKSLSNRAKTLADHPYDVPKEVEDNIARIAAERGISAGTRGQFNDFSLLRDFGVNQLQYGQTAINQAQSLTGTLAAIAPKVNPMSPLSFYVTPVQREATIANNNAQEQAIAQAARNAENAAKAAGDSDIFGSLTKIAGMFGTSGGGGGGSVGSASDAAAISSTSGFDNFIGCNVAREVYGEENPAWVEFREVMRTKMPASFVDFYRENAPEIAHEIKDQPKVKTLIRGLMDEIRKAHA